MRKTIRFLFYESILMFIYKYTIEFIFMPVYFNIFGYLYSYSNYSFSFDKWIVSNIIMLLLMFVLFENTKVLNDVYSIVIRLIYMICIIPALSVYAFLSNLNPEIIFYPVIYWIISSLILKWYSKQPRALHKEIIRMPRIVNVDMILLLTCGVLAFFIWLWAGHPLILNFSEATEQRLILRATAMPTILKYVFMLLGGTIFPYFFARNLDLKKYVRALLSFLCGVILFFVNGMKTWLFLYIIIIGFFTIYRLSKKNWHKTILLFEFMMVLLPILCVTIYLSLDVVDLMSQLGRIVIIPNNIGYRSIIFFHDNELLYLRESILRLFFSSPYPGGSDFYINYGASSTITSSRANNGLWGDAFRNFGFLGIMLYPVLFAKTINVVEKNGRGQSKRLQYFSLIMVVWSAINTSFFTWLLTGGVFVLIIVLKIYRANDRCLLKE